MYIPDKRLNSRIYTEFFLPPNKKTYNSVLKMSKRSAHVNIIWFNYFGRV